MSQLFLSKMISLWKWNNIPKKPSAIFITVSPQSWVGWQFTSTKLIGYGDHTTYLQIKVTENSFCRIWIYLYGSCGPNPEVKPKRRFDKAFIVQPVCILARLLDPRSNEDQAHYWIFSCVQRLCSVLNSREYPRIG